MKGLGRIPSEKQLEEAYARLQSATRNRAEAGIAEEELILWARWSRLDPRLGEQLTAILSDEWRRLSPFALHHANLRDPWPAALGVLLDFSLEIVRFRDGEAQAGLFSKWIDVVVHGVEPAHHEQFFIGLARLGGKLMDRDARMASKTYRKWGYLARDVLISKNLRDPRRPSRTGLSASQRKRVLDELVRDRDRFTINDYIAALDGQVHRRQAERDLANDSRLKARGNTSGRFYSVARKAPS